MNVDDKFIGIMNSCFLFAYSFSNATIGHLGDKMNITVFITIGMITALISFGFIGICAHL